MLSPSAVRSLALPLVLAFLISCGDEEKDRNPPPPPVEEAVLAVPAPPVDSVEARAAEFALLDFSVRFFKHRGVDLPRNAAIRLTSAAEYAQHMVGW